MKIAIIVDDGTNESLLRFTETKLFFDAKNQSRTLVDDSMIVSTREQAQSIIDQNPQHTYYVISTGTFLTSSFASSYADATGTHWIEPTHEFVIAFDPDTYVGFKKKSKYASGSKQLYIIENMLKSIIAAKKNVYVENTEDLFVNVDTSSVRHLFGLSSGWKTASIANQIGLDQLESITMYDVNPYQLDWAKKLHSFEILPEHLDIPYNHVGNYIIPAWAHDWWKQWHKYPVQFREIDLLSVPIFPNDSLVWISNVFNFEPLLFSLGRERLTKIKNQLINLNKHSIIVEY